MPKRSYPFSESFSSQYKVHVGQKEINNCGVFGLKCRQEVYEKTKNMLFNGTKAVMGRIWKADGEEKVSDVLVSDPAPGHQTLLRGQTTIGLDGRLKRADAVPAGLGFEEAVLSVRASRVSRLRPAVQQLLRPLLLLMLRHRVSLHHLNTTVFMNSSVSDRHSVLSYSERYERVLCCGCSS
ncbi:Apoptosis regulatory protein Siva [Anabarilius grahami]|uniref:Apoptosis regulatory protein Siva n=1 Tax=Anabarilius grahami TaxID=495550 RepID=A0A3N0XLU9_ANAGA|nr:Apoptosis regulatory protein Siva [Anabarilius grahami]